MGLASPHKSLDQAGVHAALSLSWVVVHSPTHLRTQKEETG